jgi:3-oxoacyl-[acyl-carrier protein] reductase
MKYALVTGGSRGIGRAICLKLAEMGYPILINYHSNHEAAETVKAAIEEKGGRAELLPFDVSDGSVADEILTTWQENHPDDHVAVLVNNAGIRLDNMLVFMQNNQWHQVLDTTLNGFFYLTRRVMKDMLTKRWGRIINIASLSGIKGLPGQTNYSAAKAALIGASKALAQEVGARKVTVNVVAPGFIESDMTKDLDEKTLKTMIPVGRFGKAEEVADLVGFLASDQSAYITGEVISINGGL